MMEDSALMESMKSIELMESLDTLELMEQMPFEDESQSTGSKMCLTLWPRQIGKLQSPMCEMSKCLLNLPISCGFFILLIVGITILALYLSFDPSKSLSQSMQHHRTRIAVNQKAHKLVSQTTELPICARTFLFVFTNLAGLGSELDIYTSAAATASLLNYSVVVDDSTWNYGKLSDYFDVEPLPCQLPKNWKDMPRALFSNAGKNQPDHVWSSRNDLVNNPAFRNYLMQYMDDRAANTHSVWNMVNYREQRTILPAYQNVHHTMKTIFDAKSEAYRRIWRPNKAVLEEIMKLKREINKQMLDNKQANHKSSPNFGLESPLARKLMTIHFRLGDKARENHDVTPAEHIGMKLAQGNPHPYLEVIRSFVPDWKSSKELPALFILSDDPQTALDKFNQQQSLYSPDNRFPLLLPPNEEHTEHGHLEKSFNSAPLSVRIQMGITLIRDITFAVDHSEGIVCSGSSNICKLMFHLRGSQDAIGPNGTVRSVDVRWYPTEWAHQFTQLSLEPLGNQEKIIQMAHELSLDPRNYIDL
ncbi:hypothetical protein DFH28DRAFT_1165413 [Melampsora americana]|nr:hypothetical protein DFH28DRAFT_1165413 [Melampsora americana]